MKEYITSSHVELTYLFWDEFMDNLVTLSSQDTIMVGLSGGTSLDIFYGYIGENFRDIPEHIRRKVRFCLLDERMVPVDHPDSNEGQLKKKFLTKLVEEGSITEKQIIGISSLCHFERSDNEVEKSLSEDPEHGLLSPFASSLLRRTGRPSQGQRQSEYLGEEYSKLVPHIDIALFGVGPDGHIASLFPYHPLLHSLEYGFLEITDSPKLPLHRITASPQMIRSIPYVFVAFMRGKDAVLSAFGNRNISWKACPVKILLESEYLVVMSDIEPFH